MKQSLIIACMLCIASNATAELKMVQKIEPVYLSTAGEQITPVEAVKRSIKGEKVLKCESVEAQATATGNVSMKKVK